MNLIFIFLYKNAGNQTRPAVTRKQGYIACCTQAHNRPLPCVVVVCIPNLPLQCKPIAAASSWRECQHLVPVQGSRQAPFWYICVLQSLHFCFSCFVLLLSLFFQFAFCGYFLFPAWLYLANGKMKKRKRKLKFFVCCNQIKLNLTHFGLIFSF